MDLGLRSTQEVFAAGQTDRRLAIRLNVRHGARRTTDVAREYGYTGSGGGYRIVQRLQVQAKKDDKLVRQLTRLRRELSEVQS